MFEKQKTGCRRMAGIAYIVMLVMLACTNAVAASTEIRIGGDAEACNGICHR